MGRRNWDRLSAWGGIVFIVLLVVSTLIVPQPPKVTADKLKIATYFSHHHRSGLISNIVGTLAIIPFLWFLGSLAARLRNGGEPRLGATGFGGGVIAAGLALSSGVISTTLFFGLGHDYLTLAKPLYVISLIFTTLIWFPIAALTLATTVAVLRSRVLPEWYGYLSALGSLIIVFGGPALAHKGFYAPAGAYNFIAFIAFLVWVLVTSVVLLRQRESAPVAAA